MLQKYKAKKTGLSWLHRKSEGKQADSLHVEWAEKLQKDYGLEDLFSVDDIVHIWGEYSGDHAAGWLMPSAYDVEQAFGVQLERID